MLTSGCLLLRGDGTKALLGGEASDERSGVDALRCCGFECGDVILGVDEGIGIGAIGISDAGQVDLAFFRGVESGNEWIVEAGCGASFVLTLFASESGTNRAPASGFEGCGLGAIFAISTKTRSTGGRRCASGLRGGIYEAVSVLSGGCLGLGRRSLNWSVVLSLLCHCGSCGFRESLFAEVIEGNEASEPEAGSAGAHYERANGVVAA